MASQIVPLLIFGALLVIVALVIRSFASALKFSMQDTGHGKEVHLQTPVVSLDVLPQTQMDPRLAQVPVYPGAMPLTPGVADYDAQLHLLHREFHEITANYWTASPKDAVCEFYRHSLAGWTEESSGATGSFSLKRADGIQKISIMTVGDRTYIGTGVSIRSSSAATS